MNILLWIKTHKKLTAVIVAGIFMAIFIIVAIFNMARDRFFPGDKPVTQTGLPFSNPNQSSLSIKTDKDIYSLSEKIAASVTANSENIPVTAFDAQIEFDPEFLTLTKREAAPLSDFTYFGKNDDKSFSISAVLKSASSSQTFDNTKLFTVEFTPKKKGKTIIRIDHMPGSTSESNILDQDSRDILGNVEGKEITIE